MKKKNVTLLFIFAIIALTSCAPKNHLMVDMQRHGESLYAYKVAPSEESYQRHKEVLTSIIEGSKKRRDRVPPGIYAEYGFRLLEKGSNAEAKEYFLLEKATYPESAVFMDRLVLSIGKLEGNKDKLESTKES